MIEEPFSKRLRTLMNKRGIKASELSARTHISKSQISHWINGTYKAKQDSVTILAEFFDVSEAWLMGFNVPMERDNSSVYDPDEVDILYNKYCNRLTKDDKATIKFIIENRVNERNDN